MLTTTTTDVLLCGRAHRYVGASLSAGRSPKKNKRKKKYIHINMLGINNIGRRRSLNLMLQQQRQQQQQQQQQQVSGCWSQSAVFISCIYAPKKSNNKKIRRRRRRRKQNFCRRACVIYSLFLIIRFLLRLLPERRRKSVCLSNHRKGPFWPALLFAGWLYAITLVSLVSFFFGRWSMARSLPSDGWFCWFISSRVDPEPGRDNWAGVYTEEKGNTQVMIMTK